MVISSGAEVVSQVVTKASAGRGDCANAYPGSSADVTRSRMGQVSPTGRYGSRFSAAMMCRGSSVYNIAPPPPVITSVMADVATNMAASANVNKAIFFL